MTPHEPVPAKPSRRVTVTRGSRQGWEVMEERDNRIVRRVTYTDWHRVERALGLNRRTQGVVEDIVEEER